MTSTGFLEKYLDLPEDPELAFVAFEEIERKELLSFIAHDDVPADIARAEKKSYMDRIMAFHDAHDFQFLTDPGTPIWDNEFDEKFEDFASKLRRTTLEISIRHARRMRPINVIVQLTDDMRRQIHTHIGNIRGIIHSTGLPDLKKEAIFSKINALTDEIDRDRTKAEALTALTLEIASGVGNAAKELEPAKKLLDSIENVMAKAKDLADRLGLPSPKGRPRLEPPKKQLPPPSAEDDSDDDIPF